MRAGTRVVFQPTPVSLALYSYIVPPAGARGTVTPISFGATSRTHLPGPGGGLVYVCWDETAELLGVSRNDLRRVRQGSRRTARERS